MIVHHKDDVFQIDDELIKEYLGDIKEGLIEKYQKFSPIVKMGIKAAIKEMLPFLESANTSIDFTIPKKMDATIFFLECILNIGEEIIKDVHIHVESDGGRFTQVRIVKEPDVG